MIDRRRPALAVALVASISACTPIEDEVFGMNLLAHDDEPVTLLEGSGTVEISIRLREPPEGPVSARYHFGEVDAQTTCRSPDFVAADGRTAWAAGNAEALVSLLLSDDDLPELDEALTLTLDDFQGAGLSGSEAIKLVILDDDRSAIVDARAEFGLAPGGAGDQALLLQAALDRAGELGRGVVAVAPGDYEISTVTLLAGTALSGRGARFHRPGGAPADTVGIAIAHDGAMDSEGSLVEGVTLDGRRELQGPYNDDELADAHLIALRSDPESPGRLRAAVENVALEASTASGVFIGPGVDATLCRLRAEDLWRDVVTLRGGGTRVDAREIDASATAGTTGLWFDGQPAGFDGTNRIDVTVEDTRLASGDLEIEAYDGSSIVLHRFSMTRGPFRLQAPDATVQITDSVLQTGVPSPLHNFFGLPHDVTITRTTLVTSEMNAFGTEAEPADRELAIASVRWAPDEDPDLPPRLPPAMGPHRLLFDQCTFLRGPDVDTADSVAAVETSGTGGTVIVRAPVLGSGVEALAPSCEGCSVEP